MHMPAGVCVPLMALIDCLAVINGHMLSMHIVDILTQRERRAISGEALISDCEHRIWDRTSEGSTARVCRPTTDLHFTVRMKIFKEMASPHWASDSG